MKRLWFILLAICFIGMSCERYDPYGEETEIQACGVNDPAKNLLWLTELIEAAENDTTGSYLGNIWLEQYNGQDVFVINMSLGNRDMAYHVFDCLGNEVFPFQGIGNEEIIDNRKKKKNFLNNITKDIVIYANPIIACGVTNPAKNLTWLAELIEKAKMDNTGIYSGWIWLGKYKEQDIFITNMSLGSGGILYYFFDCSGNHWAGEDTICHACKYVGNYHFHMSEDDIISFISNKNTFNVVIYSPLD